MPPSPPGLRGLFDALGEGLPEFAFAMFGDVFAVFQQGFAVLLIFFGNRADDAAGEIGGGDFLIAEMRGQNQEFIAHLKLANKEITELVKTAHETIARNSVVMERVEKKLI